MSNLIQWMRGPQRSGRLGALLATLVLSLLPALSLASEANVKLKFSQQDKIYLYASLAFGAIAVFVALYLRSSINKKSPGDEKMQEVGRAIREGALAYLRQQGSLMLVFIVILSVLLWFMYQPQFGTQVAIQTVVCFVLGVGASYFAGFIGMDSAVRANMRTAAAALTSYKNALEVSFRSGAVAGLMTVGMGLIGATVIFLVAQENATKLLIGFGFGGSLAALFMRVGGGIYTKAADVGADLVGKVEAGIPEDDPRNPAVIADNVGDNVGDCAGMAADVFESYEVTLVAAIVLGAATAVIFDQQTWMKLIMFALMARGVGIIASIIGIFMVKGSDDLRADPLKAIKKGFVASAAIAALATAGLAWYMMGGQTGSAKIESKQLFTSNQAAFEKFTKVREAGLKAAKDKKKKLAEVTEADIKDMPEIKALGLEEGALGGYIQGFGQYRPGEGMEPKAPEGYQALDLTDPKSEAYNLPAIRVSFEASEKPVATTLGEIYKTDKSAYQFEITTVVPPQAPAPGGAPGAGGAPQGDGRSGQDPTNPATMGQPQVQKQKVVLGPMSDADAKKLVEKGVGGNKVQQIGNALPVSFYQNKEGALMMALESPGNTIDLSTTRPMVNVFKETTPDKLKTFLAKFNSDPASAGEPPKQADITTAGVRSTSVPWWSFFACVLFGIIMAFAFESLTDYYVGLHNKPVQELGDISTAGPAPMIINGFAYGQESSVFSVFAIVAALIMPLLLFPVSVYGSYIMSFYGIALVGLGLLTTTGFILAMDTFGPISDNAQGVFEMSGAAHDNPEGARRVQLLDAAGNTTKALTKGFAIATAVVAAVALFHAYVEEGMLSKIGMRLEVPEIFLGMLIGGAAPYLFSAFSIKAVGRAAVELIADVRDQFRNDPGIMEGTSKPNYARCVAIVTRAAQRELLGPGILAIAFPVIVAFGFSIGKPLTEIGDAQYNLVGAQALGGFLAGTILSGQLLAVMLANSGGMWDNAKKLIEDGLHGGKGTEAHKAAVVCDTVGDPFKDTAGPALNPLIKVMNLVALLIVPQVIKPWPTNVSVTITVIAAILLGIAIWWSNRGGMSLTPKDTTPSEPETKTAESAE